MTRPMSLKTIAFALVARSLVPPRAAPAQQHAITDSSLAPSLLVAATASASTYAVPPTDSAFARRFTRLEAQYSRTSTAGAPSMLVLGLRSDGVSRDSSGWNASVFGIRTGLAQKAKGTGDVALSAIEVYFGGRTLGHLEGHGRPNVGIEAVAGWSGMETKTRASFALRMPVEMISATGRARLAFAIVPAMAWGQLRFRSCEDRGSGDGCSPLGVQFAMGRTRFVLGTGVTLSTGRGLSVTAGAQHMFARTQQPRFALALGLGR